MKLCGCVVLYNPDINVVDNMNTYLDAVDVLYVMDNSVNKNDQVVEAVHSNRKCRYMDMNGNKGIACAMNRALKRAEKNGYHWMLTMDQDSRFASENLLKIKEYIEHDMVDDVAIVCARYRNYCDNRIKHTRDITYLKETITSGGIMNVDIAKEIGGFLSELFIDEVDNEYCFRAITRGYKIARMNNVLFDHAVGNQVIRKEVRTFNYAPFRYYYLIRNETYVIEQYKKYAILEDICKEKQQKVWVWFHRVWHEEKRLQKYGYMILGYIHGKLGVLGKI